LQVVRDVNRKETLLERLVDEPLPQQWNCELGVIPCYSARPTDGSNYTLYTSDVCRW